MSDLEQMLTRQAEWQKSRQSLTWPEKIRMAERVLASVRQWRVRPIPDGEQIGESGVQPASTTTGMLREEPTEYGQ